MNNKKLILPLVLMLSSLVGCQNPTNTESVSESTPIINNDMVNQSEFDAPYASKLSEGGKAVIVNRKQVPQVMLSALLRTDLLINADFMDSKDMEDYFAICKETGMNTIELSVMWSQIEPEKDSYDFSDIKNYLDFAKKYDLKINIEWYGSLTDGETHTANIPTYVSSDTKTYTVIQDMFDFANYGRCKILDYDNPKLLERESLAIYNMMNYIYEWNHENDLYDPVVMVQIGQGTDRLQRWRVDAYKIKDSSGNLMSSADSWSMVHTYLNEVARGVKYSKYKALTRVEFCEQSAVVNYVRDVEKLENIDIVSPTYLHTIPAVKSGIKSFTDEYTEMPIMNVENWASDDNYKQILATMAMGGIGYVSYQLSCPNHFPEAPNGALYGRYNENGTTLAEKFTQRGTRATDTKQINNALTKAYVAVANAKRANFAAFGLNNLVNSATGSARIQKIFLNNGLLFDYSNPENATGFAIYDNNYVYVYSSKDATLEINNCSITVAQKGYFDNNGEWVNEGVVSLESNKKLAMEHDVVYRVRIASISELPSMASLEEQGYKGVLDSIRG